MDPNLTCDHIFHNILWTRIRKKKKNPLRMHYLCWSLNCNLGNSLSCHSNSNSISTSCGLWLNQFKFHIVIWKEANSEFCSNLTGLCTDFYQSTRNLKNVQGSHHQRNLVFLCTFLELNYIFINIALYSVLFSGFICEVKFSYYFYKDWNSLHCTILLWYHWFQAYPPFNGK